MPNSTRKMTLREWAGEERRQLALLLTDIIDSTRLAANRGDEKWVDDVLIPHFARARYLCDTFEGKEIKLIGDAYMAVFKTADAALSFGREFIVDPGNAEIYLRVAIHSGRVRILENDIYGLMANFTARLITAIDQQQEPFERSRIVVSNQALTEIIAAYGDTVRPDFTPFGADLKSFGKHRVWFCRSKDVMIEVIKRRRRQKAQIATQTQR